MRRPWLLALLAFGGVAVAAPAALAPGLPPELSGTWLNPHRSVAVRTGRCGALLCGWIVWVTAEAAQDARDGGVANPVGTEVLRDYRPGSDGRWRGTVYVVDLGRSFSSALEPLGDGRLKISGCLVGGLICKSQIWRRS